MPEYVMNLLKHVVFGQGMRNLIKGTAITNLLSVKKLGEKLIPLPPLNVQQEFVDRVRNAQNMTAQQLESVSSIGNLQSSLLQRAFRGEL